MNQQRVALPDQRRLPHVPVTGERPDPQHPAIVPDVAELAVQLVDGYDHLGRGQPELHHREEAVPPRHEVRLGAVPPQ